MVGVNPVLTMNVQVSLNCGSCIIFGCVCFVHTLVYAFKVDCFVKQCMTSDIFKMTISNEKGCCWYAIAFHKNMILDNGI